MNEYLLANFASELGTHFSFKLPCREWPHLRRSAIKYETSPSFYAHRLFSDELLRSKSHNLYNRPSRVGSTDLLSYAHFNPRSAHHLAGPPSFIELKSPTCWRGCHADSMSWYNPWYWARLLIHVMICQSMHYPKFVCWSSHFVMFKMSRMQCEWSCNWIHILSCLRAIFIQWKIKVQ